VVVVGIPNDILIQFMYYYPGPIGARAIDYSGDLYYPIFIFNASNEMIKESL
jgi:hypothetical protein